MLVKSWKMYISLLPHIITSPARELRRAAAYDNGWAQSWCCIERTNRLCFLINIHLEFQFFRKIMVGINEYKFLFLLLKIFSFFIRKRIQNFNSQDAQTVFVLLKILWRFLRDDFRRKRHKHSRRLEQSYSTAHNPDSSRKKKSRSETATSFLQNHSPERKISFWLHNIERVFFQRSLLHL